MVWARSTTRRTATSRQQWEWQQLTTIKGAMIGGAFWLAGGHVVSVSRSDSSSLSPHCGCHEKHKYGRGSDIMHVHDKTSLLTWQLFSSSQLASAFWHFNFLSNAAWQLNRPTTVYRLSRVRWEIFWEMMWGVHVGKTILKIRRKLSSLSVCTWLLQPNHVNK